MRYQPVSTYGRGRPERASGRAPARRPRSPERSRYGSSSRSCAVDARAEQHEAVRLEERAEVAVGEQARVRRVALALEAVELDRRERVERRELVDHEDAAARPRHTRHLREHELGPRDVVKRPPRSQTRSNELRGRTAAAWRRPRRARRSRGDPRRTRPRSSSSGTRSTPTTSRTWRRERERERAGAGADVERTLVARRLDEVDASRASSAGSRRSDASATRSAFSEKRARTASSWLKSPITTRLVRRGSELMPVASS